MTCGGYDSKVSLVEFDPGCGRLASSGGARCTVWDFEGGSPAGSVPAVTVGHSGTITAQVRRGSGSVAHHSAAQRQPGLPACTPPILQPADRNCAATCGHSTQTRSACLSEETNQTSKPAPPP
jgi:hypothetical protein